MYSIRTNEAYNAMLIGNKWRYCKKIQNWAFILPPYNNIQETPNVSIVIGECMHGWYLCEMLIKFGIGGFLAIQICTMSPLSYIKYMKYKYVYSIFLAKQVMGT